MRRYLLRMFERAAIEQIGGDPGGAKSMTIGGRAQGCLAASALDHTQHVMPAHPHRSQAALFSTTLSKLEFLGAIAVNELQFDQFAECGTAQPFADATMELRQRHPPAVRAWGKKRPAGVRALCTAGAGALPTTPENYSSALW